MYYHSRMATSSTQPPLDQLKRAVAISQQIEDLQSELESILGGASPRVKSDVAKVGKKGKRRGRPPGIKNAISELLDATPAPKAKKAAKKKRAMSEEGRKKIAEAQKKRWAAKKGK